MKLWPTKSKVQLVWTLMWKLLPCCKHVQFTYITSYYHNCHHFLQLATFCLPCCLYFILCSSCDRGNWYHLPRLKYVSCDIFIIIIISPFYCSVEHRAWVKVRHLVLFAAKAFFEPSFSSLILIHLALSIAMLF
jgi:hypothetical protein